jgi:hypothetical protein
MSFRGTWVWIGLAAGLFALILLLQRQARQSAAIPFRILSQINPAAVTSVQVRPAGQLEIRAERTNQAWQLTRPLSYPAQAASIDNLLAALRRLTPAARITARERRLRPKADEEDGLDPPRTSLTLLQGADGVRVIIGSNTPPGDQLFLRVEGVEEVYVVDADLLKFIPRTANDWRDTTLISFKGLAPDRICVTNGTTVFCLQRDPPTPLWRMVHPIQARADNAKIQEYLQSLETLRVNQFLPEDAKTDLESLGLQPAELDLAFAQGTNSLAWLQFGKSPTNDIKQVFARRLGQNAIVTVSKDLLAPWHGVVNDFRDPHLLALTQPVEAIDVRGLDQFTLQHETNGTWRVTPQGFAADAALVKEMVTNLSRLRVAEFTKDAVVEPDLPAYGLASPAQKYTLRAAPVAGTNAPTNNVIAELSFGTNQNDRVFARREDESFVYAVKLADFQALPSASWQMRERRIWSLATNEIARVIIRQQGKERQIIHNGPHQWALAPGSTGLIEDLAVEGTVRGLAQLAAAAWLALGEKSRGDYGLSDTGQQVTLELKNGEKQTVDLGKPPFAAVTLEGKPWIFEMPWQLHRDVLSYLSIPGNSP